MFAPVRPSPGLVARLRGAVEFRLRGWRRRGISVALLGPDGAGKTTLAGEIDNSFIFPVRRVYMGLTGGLLRHVNRLRVPGLVLLRTGRMDTPAQWARIGSAIDRYGPKLFGRFTVIDAARIRSRPLPVDNRV